MTDLKIAAIIGIASVILYASPAMAEMATEETVTKTEVQNTQVLSAIERSDLVPVETEDGKTYYNHYVSKDELHDATISYETVDTYTFEHNGRTYTNKIVAE